MEYKNFDSNNGLRPTELHSLRKSLFSTRCWINVEESSLREKIETVLYALDKIHKVRTGAALYFNEDNGEHGFLGNGQSGYLKFNMIYLRRYVGLSTIIHEVGHFIDFRDLSFLTNKQMFHSSIKSPYLSEWRMAIKRSYSYRKLKEFARNKMKENETEE